MSQSSNRKVFVGPWMFVCAPVWDKSSNRWDNSWFAIPGGKTVHSSAIKVWAEEFGYRVYYKEF